MIRINLLPYHEIAQKENLARQILIVAGSVLLFVLLIGGVQLFFQYSNAGLESDIKAKEERLIVLNKVIGEVETIKREKQLLERKLAIINSLEQNRSYPVRLFAEVASQVPVREVWLEKLAQSGTAMTVEGKAKDNFAVVRFMKSLEGSMYFASVELVASRQFEIAGVKLQSFTLSCVLRKGV